MKKKLGRILVGLFVGLMLVLSVPQKVEAIHFFPALVDINVGSRQTALVNDQGVLVSCWGTAVLWEERRFDFEEITHHFVSWLGNHYAECDGNGDPGDKIFVSGELITETGIPIAATPWQACDIVGYAQCPLPVAVTQSTYRAEKIYAITHVQIYDAGQQRQFDLYWDPTCQCIRDPKTECFKPKDVEYSSSTGTEPNGFITPENYTSVYISGTNSGARAWQFANIKVNLSAVPDNIGNGQLQVTVKALQGSAPGLSVGYARGVGEDPDLTVDTSSTGPISAGETRILYGNGNSPFPNDNDYGYFSIGVPWNIVPNSLEYEILSIVWVYGTQTLILY